MTNGGPDGNLMISNHTFGNFLPKFPREFQRYSGLIPSRVGFFEQLSNFQCPESQLCVILWPWTYFHLLHILGD